MWQYQYTNRYDYRNNYLMHREHKYIDKKMINGTWRYSYKNAISNVTKVASSVSKAAAFIGSYASKAVSSISSAVINAGKSFISTTAKVADYVSKNAFTTKSTWSNGETKPNTNTNKKYKYIAKVETANGKTRYFYDQAAYDRYLKRQEYQANEPEFMKDIPETQADLTDDEEMAEVNPNLDKGIDDVGYSTNCMYCTTAYELRQRGYDVEASVAGPDYDETLDSLSDYYKNPKVYKLKDVSTANGFKSTISNSFPPESRGNFMVYWDNGGGHSMAWETNSEGECIIRDTQHDTIYTKSQVQAIIDSSSDMYVCQTDNLELKDGVKEVFINNDK